MVRAHIVLKGPAGGATSGKPVSSQNVQGYVADLSERERVCNLLEKLGFSICRVSPLSITVEAPVDTFETVFRARLKQVDLGQQPPSKQKADQVQDSGRQFLWAWSEPLRIPTEMSDAVDTVVFPQPTRRMIQ